MQILINVIVTEKLCTYILLKIGWPLFNFQGETVTYLWLLCYFAVEILELCLVCASTPYPFIFVIISWHDKYYMLSSFFCNVFLTIHTLVCYNICSVCVCVCVLNLSKLPVYYCIKISYRKLQILKFFLCSLFYSTKYISKTCIAFCWYHFGWDIATARHRYANNRVNNWVFKFLWLGQFAMWWHYQRYFQGIWYLCCTSQSCTSTITLTSILFLLHKFSFQDCVSFSIEISFGLQSSWSTILNGAL